MSLGELEAEQVEQAASHVELARYPQIQQVIADQIARQAQGAVHCVGRDEQQAVDHAIEQQMKGPTRDHLQACLLDLVDAAREVSALERTIVNHRKMREDIIGQDEKVAECIDERLSAVDVLPFVEIKDHPEHEHRRDDGDDPARGRLGA